MNAQNAHKYLPLVQALVDGKTLQYRDGFGNWGDTGGIYIPYFDADHTSYRIKPKPRTFEMWLFHPLGRLYPFIEGEECWGETADWERITVQEVLK